MGPDASLEHEQVRQVQEEGGEAFQRRRRAWPSRRRQRAFAASGLENSFSIERFRRDFRVVVRSLSEEEIVFDLIGIDAALANAAYSLPLHQVETD